MLLLAAVVAALAVIKGATGGIVDKVQVLLSLAVAMFAIGMVGVIIRRNVLVMLMCMELMLNGVNLASSPSRTSPARPSAPCSCS